MNAYPPLVEAAGYVAALAVIAVFVWALTSLLARFDMLNDELAALLDEGEDGNAS